jgi:hypothetical protein
VWYDPGNGVVAQSRWEDVRASSRTLLVGRQLVQIIDQRKRYLYSQAEIESQLLSHLPPTAFLGDRQLLLEGLRRGNVTLWFSAVGLALYLGYFLLRWSQPELMSRLGAQLMGLFR